MTFPLTGSPQSARVTFAPLLVKSFPGVQHTSGLNSHQRSGKVTFAPLLVKSFPGLHTWNNTTPNIESIQPPTIGQIWPRGNRPNPT